MYIYVARKVKGKAIGLARKTANQYVSEVQAPIICKQTSQHQLAHGRISSSTLIEEDNRHLSDNVRGLSDDTAVKVMLGQDRQRQTNSINAIVTANNHHRRITEMTVRVRRTSINRQSMQIVVVQVSVGLPHRKN